MQMFGFTLNLLTLLAIVLSVGLVVDDAIVVVENVERHLREGRSPREAAMLGRASCSPGNSDDPDVGRRTSRSDCRAADRCAVREFAFTWLARSRYPAWSR